MNQLIFLSMCETKILYLESHISCTSWFWHHNKNGFGIAGRDPTSTHYCSHVLNSNQNQKLTLAIKKFPIFTMS